MIRLIFISILFFSACAPDQKKEHQEVVLKKDTTPVTADIDDISNHDCIKLFKKAKAMDSTILKQLDLNIELANKAIRVFTDYAFYCESDSLSPVYLVKSAQIAISINNPDQAKIVLDRCIRNYPKFKNKPAALFLLAQLYDEQNLLNNEAEAKKIYEQVIFDYPKSEWAANAKDALKLLGKTDQQIINEFNKKGKK